MALQGLDVVAPAGVGRRRGLLPRSRRVWALVALSIVALAAAGAPLADGDSFGDLVDSLASLAGGIGAVRWAFLPILLAVAGLHYVCAALALRAAAGSRLPMGPTTLAQLAASAANRVTPAGLGGAAVNVRFLSRSGLENAGALGAVAALGVLGSAADLLLIILLVAGGTYVGLGGGHAELSSLGNRLAHLAALPALSPTTWIVGAALVLAIVLATRSWRRPFQPVSDQPSRAQLVADMLRHMVGVARRPGDLITLLAASAATTFLLGVALAVSVLAIPGHLSGSSFGMVIMAYLLGAAAGSAIPVPAGIGSTEAALVAAMVVAHVPAGHALQSVLLFRLTTFWAPAMAGLPAARVLRAQGAI